MNVLNRLPQLDSAHQNVPLGLDLAKLGQAAARVSMGSESASTNRMDQYMDTSLTSDRLLLFLQLECDLKEDSRCDFMGRKLSGSSLSGLFLVKLQFHAS